jgi:hypothetical protein
MNPIFMAGLRYQLAIVIPAKAGKSREPSIRQSELFERWQCLTGLEMLVPRRNGPRLCAGVTGEWVA